MAVAVRVRSRGGGGERREISSYDVTYGNGPLKDTTGTKLSTVIDPKGYHGTTTTK